MNTMQLFVRVCTALRCYFIPLCRFVVVTAGVEADMDLLSTVPSEASGLLFIHSIRNDTGELNAECVKVMLVPNHVGMQRRSLSQ